MIAHIVWFTGKVISQLTFGFWGSLGFCGGGRGRKKEKSNAFRFCQEEKQELAKSKTKLALAKMWENTRFRKLSPKQVQSPDSHTEREQEVGTPQTNQINQPSGKQVITQTGQGFPSLIPVSFQKWRLQKLPKHPPNNLHPSSTIGKPLFMRSFTFSFKRGWFPPAPHGAQWVGWVLSCLLQPEIKEENEFGSMEAKAFLSKMSVQRKVTITEK